MAHHEKDCHEQPTSQPTKPRFNVQRVNTNLDVLHQFKQGHTEALKRYTGFGGLRGAFKDETVQARLATCLSADDIERLRKSASTSYFTPAILVDFVYAIIQKLGVSHGQILEPACGHGAFFERMPTAMCEQSQVTGIEFDPLSAAMAKALYPDITIINQGFQSFHEDGFDLIIGNPPYASFSVFDRQHPDLSHEMIHHYFVAKSVRLLKEGGLLAMVVPCYVLDNPKRHLRKQIAEVADLVAAYRFPDSLFDDARITVDVVVFQRKANPHTQWQSSKQVKFANKQRVYLADYFIQHPEHVLGELDSYEVYSQFESRPRIGLKCVGTLAEVQTRLPQLVSELHPVFL